ncbi:MAG TPA: CHRD domain-containing protein, partial [Chitinophagaceae bacterium]|nr:CHRD domain-containing protein [Chitinophagaceae bacterium]
PVIDISDEITVNGVGGTISGNTIVADSVETFLLDGRIYYNIHTAAYPNGEIRGQVTTTPKN